MNRRVTLPPDADDRAREQAQRVVAPWSSAPDGDTEWRIEEDGSITIYRAED